MKKVRANFYPIRLRHHGMAAPRVRLAKTAVLEAQNAQNDLIDRSLGATWCDKVRQGRQGATFGATLERHYAVERLVYVT